MMERIIQLTSGVIWKEIQCDFMDYALTMIRQETKFKFHKADNLDFVGKGREDRPDMPLFVYGGWVTYPYLHDPDQNIKGGIAIVNNELIYDKMAHSPYNFRDSYLWNGIPFEHYVCLDFKSLVSRFIDYNFPFFESDNLGTNDKNRGTKINKICKISIDDLG